ncbi:MAG: DUF29 domain-containing protein [Microcystaceae cyanobacterium]
MKFIKELKQLYDQDFVLWVDKTTDKIRQGDITNLDWEHLLEEIEDLGREQRNKVESYLIQTVKHLLMYQYWLSEKDYCAKGWADEIDNFRIELEILFQSKTLYNYGTSIVDRVYNKAKRSVIKKTGLSSTIFPNTCPYSFEEIVDVEFLP